MGPKIGRKYRSDIQVIDQEGGFTLVEVLAVLVVLGILAAVAIPKYFFLKDIARQKAIESAISKSVVRINQHFAEQLLEGVKFDQINYQEDILGTNLDDFTLSIVRGQNASVSEPIIIEVHGLPGTIVEGAFGTKTIPRPGSGPRKK